MVQQTIDTKLNEYGQRNAESGLPTCDRQLSVAMKKTPLRDLQNENRIMMPNSIGKSPFPKDRCPITDGTKVSGSKRRSPECPVRPPCHQSPGSHAANGHLVYVRRKSEAEFGKSNACDSPRNNGECTISRQLGHQEETAHEKLQMKEPNISCFPAIAPIPMASVMNSSTVPSVPPFGKSATRLAPAESNYHSFVPSISSSDNSKRIKNINWEERHHHLQMLLRNLDQSNQEDYLQLLRSLSSVELSGHAVELEKRSIQLSLEEVKEMKRVVLLNIMGKSPKNFKEPSNHQDQSEK